VSAAAKVLEAPHKPNALSLAYTRGVAEQNDNARIRDRDVAAFELMCRPVSKGGQRPLKPPPLPVGMPSRVSAGAVALRRDKVLGVYEEPRK